MQELKKKLERYLLVNMLGPGPHLMKKNLPGRGLTKVEKHCSTEWRMKERKMVCVNLRRLCVLYPLFKNLFHVCRGVSELCDSRYRSSSTIRMISAMMRV